MDPKLEDQTVDETVADETASPAETDGASSSDAADQGSETLADAMAKEFAEKYGDAEPGAEEPAPEEPEPEPESEQTPETAAQDADDPDDDEFRIPDEQFKALPDGVKKRIGHLNTRWKKAERELSEVKTELPTLKDAHERFTRIQSFVQEHNIEPENVTKMFDMVAMLSRGDYKGFLETIKPFYDHAAQAAGQTIAPDLQKQVEDGYLTEEHARELTAARMQGQTYKSQADRYRQQSEQLRQQHTQQVEQSRMIDAITQREAHLKATDPDYAQKQPMLKAMVELALKNGARPQNAQQAIALVDDAYTRVSAMAPAPRPARPTTPRPSASSPPRGAPAPKTLEEAIEQSLSQMPS